MFTSISAGAPLFQYFLNQVHAWFSEIVFVKVCACVHAYVCACMCVYLSMFFRTHSRVTEQNC